MTNDKKCPFKSVALAVDNRKKWQNQEMKSCWNGVQNQWRPSWIYKTKLECQWHVKVACKRETSEEVK